ncbi:MAG: ABC transporter ATP-binding protein [candidate division Zixibacteria bacterium]|nr:ABC transporter ATP-binding protein [candidate division Zixibacteria bacterium]
MNNTASAIQVTGLSKTFRGVFGGREVRALDDVSLEVNTGEIFGLLGPNGAGKTTLVKILLGALHPSAGSGRISGHDMAKAPARAKVGFLPENHRFPQYHTGGQMLVCYGGMAGLSQIEAKRRSDHLLALVGMAQWRHTKIKKYSKGMMQRLGLAQALLNDPEIVFLDEPTDGVDPIGRHEIRAILLNLKKQGKTIFLNSHLLAEVESVCDRVAILDRGRLIKTGPVSGLIGTKPAYRIELTALTDDIADKVKAKYPHAQIEQNAIAISFHEARDVNGLIDLLRGRNAELLSVTPIKVSLEESFMQLIRGNVPHD